MGLVQICFLNKVLSWTLFTKEDVKAEGCLACSDHEMVEFSILRGGSTTKCEVTALEVSLFRYLLDTVPWEKAMEEIGVQESWLIVRDRLLQPQEQSIPMSRKPGKKN